MIVIVHITVFLLDQKVKVRSILVSFLRSRVSPFLTVFSRFRNCFRFLTHKLNQILNVLQHTPVVPLLSQDGTKLLTRFLRRYGLDDAHNNVSELLEQTSL